MRRGLIVLLPLAVVLALASWKAEGPPPLSASAPASSFSAERALATLRAVQPEGIPHPIASPANVRVRERIEAEFRKLGYATEVQRRFACNAAAMCGQVENVIARAPDNGPGEAVVLVAHYDSVPAGPGASDDGMGVATLLEVARAIRGERFRNPIIFLVDDGEEAGLLGAEAFVADEALARQTSVVINVENRGTHGVSSMFETSRGNRWLIRHLAGALKRPQASSLFFAIYDLLPNDTDVTVFKRAGKAAVNFAAVRGVNAYHTPLDSIQNASPRTLQHHGDNVLSTTRALADADLAARSSTDATYFDVLGFLLVWWPQEWTLWIAIVSLILLIVAARKTAPRAMTFGVLTAFAAILFALLAGAGVAWLLHLRDHGMNWVAHPEPSIVAMWLTGFGSALLAASLFARRSEPLAMLYGIAIVWHMIGIALAATMPGAAFVFIVPAAAVTICALARANELTTTAVASIAGAVLIFPVGVRLYDALGERLIAALAVVIAIFAMLVAPLFARMRVAIAVLAAAIVCVIVAALLPAYSASRPQTINITYVDDPQAKGPQWITWDLTDRLRAAASFQNAEPSLTPWNRGTAFAASAPRVELPRVQLSGERRGNVVVVRARTSRRAPRMVLIFKRGTVRRVNGTPLPPRPARWRERTINGWNYAVVNGVEEMVVEIAASGRVEAVASDVSFGLPDVGRKLLEERAASTAVPVHEGDNTITRARGSW